MQWGHADVRLPMEPVSVISPAAGDQVLECHIAHVDITSNCITSNCTIARALITPADSSVTGTNILRYICAVNA